MISHFLASAMVEARFSSRNLWTGRWRKIWTSKMTSTKTKLIRFFLPKMTFKSIFRLKSRNLGYQLAFSETGLNGYCKTLLAYY